MLWRMLSFHVLSPINEDNEYRRTQWTLLNNMQSDFYADWAACKLLHYNLKKWCSWFLNVYSTLTSGSVSVLPTILFLTTGVVKELAPRGVEKVSTVVTTALQCLKVLCTSPLIKEPTCSSAWKHHLQSAMATVLDYCKPGLLFWNCKISLLYILRSLFFLRHLKLHSEVRSCAALFVMVESVCPIILLLPVAVLHARTSQMKLFLF